MLVVPWSRLLQSIKYTLKKKNIKKIVSRLIVSHWLDPQTSPNLNSTNVSMIVFWAANPVKILWGQGVQSMRYNYAAIKLDLTDERRVQPVEIIRI